MVVCRVWFWVLMCVSIIVDCFVVLCGLVVGVGKGVGVGVEDVCGVLVCKF